MIEKLEAIGFSEPFPHLIFNDFYNEKIRIDTLEITGNVERT